MRFLKKRTFSVDTRVLGLVGVLLGLALVAFGFDLRASPSYSHALVVVTRQGGGQVMFDAYENLGRLWSTPGAPRAISILLVTTRRTPPGETVLWQIETPIPQQGPIAYGRVPAGFVQMIPGTGAPPALRPEEDYVVAVRGPGGTGRTHFNVRPAPRAD